MCTYMCTYIIISTYIYMYSSSVNKESTNRDNDNELIDTEIDMSYTEALITPKHLNNGIKDDYENNHEFLIDLTRYINKYI
jgi:hypothetical protein